VSPPKLKPALEHVQKVKLHLVKSPATLRAELLRERKILKKLLRILRRRLKAVDAVLGQ